MKKLVKFAFVAAFAIIAGYNVYSIQKEMDISDFTLNGVDALANNEIEIYSGFGLFQEGRCKVCRRDENNRCNVHDQVPC